MSSLFIFLYFVFSVGGFHLKSSILANRINVFIQLNLKQST